ncbi:hypothetical protein [Streptomyces sp. RerS4]|uniref:hypothetical protein n=1 Tax=Streptomyces sp. RerS4 TaxID=2942449 RepID=UPI00201C22B1|nr:hypothetical protein [Streptomyces sp. RerS4]UQX03068.1 hypothetical protein M4D82_23150 [Streptomyces sp. RerS4]
MGLTEQLASPDPREREAAAWAVAAAVWDPDTESVLAAALTAAARVEEDPAARRAQLEALPAVEGGLSDADLERLGRLLPAPAALERLLARAGRLQVCAPARPSGAATLTEVRCLRGAPYAGLGLRTPDGAWVVLERIEFQGRAVARLDTGRTARVLLSGPGARGLGEWDRLEADPARGSAYACCGRPTRACGKAPPPAPRTGPTPGTATPDACCAPPWPAQPAPNPTRPPWNPSCTPSCGSPTTSRPRPSPCCAPWTGRSCRRHCVPTWTTCWPPDAPRTRRAGRGTMVVPRLRR